MADNLMVDRWNAIDAAAMAVGVEGVLHRVIYDKPRPFDFNDALGRGVEFLREAGTGGAIFCGNSPGSGFTGTLSPLCWSTDAYIEIRSGRGPEDESFYRDVLKALQSYENVLNNLISGKKCENTESRNALNFFHALAELLIEQADPTTKRYSHEVCEPA